MDTDATIPQESPPKPARDALGRLLPGHTANPSGRPSANHWKKYGERAQQLMKGHTLRQLVEMVKSGAYLDMEAADAMVIKHIVNTLDDKPTPERQMLIERIEGKVKQEVDQTLLNPDGSPVSFEKTLVINFDPNKSNHTS